MDARTTTEEIKVSGSKLMSTLKRIAREGNVRRVVVRNSEGRTILDVPLSAAGLGAFLMPFWAAIGGVAALAARYTIVVERVDGAVVPVDRA